VAVFAPHRAPSPPRVSSLQTRAFPLNPDLVAAAAPPDLAGCAAAHHATPPPSPARALAGLPAALARHPPVKRRDGPLYHGASDPDHLASHGVAPAAGALPLGRLGGAPGGRAVAERLLAAQAGPALERAAERAREDAVVALQDAVSGEECGGRGGRGGRRALPLPPPPPLSLFSFPAATPPPPSPPASA